MSGGLPRLAFPGLQELRLEDRGGRTYVWDELRRKAVRLTPEEWVRQHLVRFLNGPCGWPRGLTAVERRFEADGASFRADVVVLDRSGRPKLLAECKAPHVPLRRDCFEQLARYNRVLRARWLVVTNGLVHHCQELDPDASAYRSLDSFPRQFEGGSVGGTGAERAP